MPLNAKGKKIKEAFREEYGDKKGEQVFYAMENKGKLKGITTKKHALAHHMKKSGPDKGVTYLGKK